MADKKISQLTAATTPLAGTEVLPIVQNGTTVKVSVDNLTTGKPVSATNITATGDLSSVGNTYLATTSTNKFGVGTSSIANGKYQFGAGGEGGITYNGTNNRPWYANGLNVGSYNTTTSSLFVNTAAYNGGDASYNSGFGVDGSYGGNVSTIRVIGLGVRSSGFSGKLSFCTNNNATITEGLSIAGATNDVTVSAGNLVIGTSGKGIDFSATASGSGTMTSELLADYEEGTWTPVDASGAGLTLTITSATYTKVGRQVTAQFDIAYPTTANATTQLMGGLPYTSANSLYGGLVSYTTHAAGLNLLILNNATTVSFRLAAGGSNQANASYSGKVIRGVCVYYV